jgi:hypothetical protein
VMAKLVSASLTAFCIISSCTARASADDVMLKVSGAYDPMFEATLCWVMVFFVSDVSDWRWIKNV